MTTALCLGCAGRKNTAAPGQDTAGAFSNVPGVIVTPERNLTGKVVRVNSQARFVVLNFPVGRMPVIEQKMNVYRGGLRTGEVRITGPQHDDHIVADIVNGNAEPGDEVRER